MTVLEALQVEDMQKQIVTLKNEKLRIFKAFACANVALKFHPGGDTRTDADIEEAQRLIAYETGETSPYRAA